MKKEAEKIIIGYSGFILFEECYVYNENACYLAASSDSMKQLIKDCGYGKSEVRVEEIRLKDLMSDFGYSMGEYAMEKVAYDHFKMLADKQEINFIVEDYEEDPTLKVVKIIGV